MAIWVAIILIVIALIAGLIGGFLLARKYMKDYLRKIHLSMRKCYV